MAEDSSNSVEDPSKFNSKKHTRGGESALSPYTRITDGYANINKMFISFLHVPSGRQIYFKAFITSFNETYNSDWSAEPVFGRVDPIYLFRSTTRQVALNFKIPAATESEAFDNLGKVQQLVQFLYPNYTSVGRAQTISQSPMVRLKVLNLLHNQKGAAADTGSSAKLLAQRAATTFNADKGVLGVIANLSVNHNLEGDDGSFQEGHGTVLPKLIDIAITFNPIHEHPIGWSGKTPHNEMFPYGINYKSDQPGESDWPPIAPLDETDKTDSDSLSSETSDGVTNAESPASPTDEQPLHPDVSAYAGPAASSQTIAAARGFIEPMVELAGRDSTPEETATAEADLKASLAGLLARILGGGGP